MSTSQSGIEHHNSRNSSNDPSVSSTHSRSVSSNSRVHPRASNHVSHDSKSRSHDKMGSAHDSKSRFHDHHHKTPKRKKSTGAEDESAVWTEHVSSSGRIYYYNKKEDKSQWEKPKDYIKQYVLYSTHWICRQALQVCTNYMLVLFLHFLCHLAKITFINISNMSSPWQLEASLCTKSIPLPRTKECAQATLLVCRRLKQLVVHTVYTSENPVYMSTGICTCTCSCIQFVIRDPWNCYLQIRVYPLSLKLISVWL